MGGRDGCSCGIESGGGQLRNRGVVCFPLRSTARVESTGELKWGFCLSSSFPSLSFFLSMVFSLISSNSWAS